MAGINGGCQHGRHMRNIAAPAASSARWRVPVRALGRLRWRMFRNGMRSSRARWNSAHAPFAFVIYAAMGLGLSVGMGVGAYVMVSRANGTICPSCSGPSS